MIALITGITGQDGSYMADLLLSHGYEVHGIIRRSSTDSTQRISHILDKITLHFGDMTDGTRICGLVRQIKPDEIYNFAAQSDVKISFSVPYETMNSIIQGSVNILDTVRYFDPSIKVYQACSSEMYGSSSPPQNETTAFRPVNPYACAKLCIYNLGHCYRYSYNMFVTNGILFNHESPRRGDHFVTKKVALAIARITKGLQDNLELGNLYSTRDWGYAPEYCDAVYRMMQLDNPDDFVLSTGETHSVEEYVEKSFDAAGLKWKDYVTINKSLFRDQEVDSLCGDASKAKEKLGWSPVVKFDELCKIMVDDAIEKLS